MLIPRAIRRGRRRRTFRRSRADRCRGRGAAGGRERRTGLRRGAGGTGRAGRAGLGGWAR